MLQLEISWQIEMFASLKGSVVPVPSPIDDSVSTLGSASIIYFVYCRIHYNELKFKLCKKYIYQCLTLELRCGKTLFHGMLQSNAGYNGS